MKNLKLITLLLLSCFGGLVAQDIEAVLEAPIINSSGGVTISQIATETQGREQTKDPYNYYVSGNLNTNLFGVVSMPVSFSYTNNHISTHATQPFNRLTFSPSYKWVTLHGGYTSMNFSPYTLGGHEFIGGGVEIAPEGPLKCSFLYGRFKKAIAVDSLGSTPSYRRMGGGLKLDYTHKRFDVSVNVFKAKDDVNSISFSPTDSLYLAPQDNLAGGLNLTLRLIENLSLNVDYSFSFLNKDILRSDSTSSTINDLFDKEKEEVHYFDAWKTSLAYSIGPGSIGLTYERVMPNYHTLGAYYFTNDFENITCDLSSKIGEKTTASVNVGYQHDDLMNQKAANNSRMILSSNISSQLNDKLNLGASYSNLTSYTHIRSEYDNVTQTNQYQNLDTLSFTQLNQTATVTSSYVLKASKEQRQNINAAFTLQTASQEQQYSDDFTGTTIFNTNVSHMLAMMPRHLSISSSLNVNHNKLQVEDMTMTSLTLALRKGFVENTVKTGISTTYSYSSPVQDVSAKILNVRLNAGYTFLRRHNLNLNLSMVNNSAGTVKYSEYSAHLSYSYNFNMKLTREKLDDVTKLKFDGQF